MPKPLTKPKARTLQVDSEWLRIDDNDPQTMHGGISIAVKARYLGYLHILLAEKQSDGKWTGVADLTGELFANDPGPSPESVIAQYGSAVEFVRKVVVPNLNAALLRRFPPSGTPLTPEQQIDAALRLLRFVPQPDGTLVANLP